MWSEVRRCTGGGAAICGTRAAYVRAVELGESGQWVLES